MPLCITGMHRSGTSMATRLLNLCGLYLGPAGDLLSPAADNPEGFWENRQFLRLNDAVLKALGGRWDRLPGNAVAGWENQRGLRWLRGRAGKLARQFHGRDPWGWKDPRNCITLPFWRRHVADLRVLVCIRNPLAVAQSLYARSGMSYQAAFDLWLASNRGIMALTAPGNRLVTHYDSYFHDPHAELRRLLKLADIAATNETVERACATIKPALNHHAFTTSELLEVGASEELVDFYLEMCAEAENAERIPVRLDTTLSPVPSSIPRAMSEAAA